MTKKKEESKVDDDKQVSAGANSLPAELGDFGEFAGQGFEDQTRDDIAIPFLNILQSNSPQVEDEDSQFRGGMLFNTVTGMAIDGKKGAVFVPCKTEHNYVEWIPRGETGGGGGYVGTHAIDSEIVAVAKDASEDYGKYFTPQGNKLVETFYIYAIMLDEEGEYPECPVIMAFTSTKIKHYRNWSGSINMFRPRAANGSPIQLPMFAHRVRLTTWQDKNNDGTFYNVKFAPAETSIKGSLIGPKDERFQAAEMFYQQVQDGVAKADFGSADKTEGDGDGRMDPAAEADKAGKGPLKGEDDGTPF